MPEYDLFGDPLTPNETGKINERIAEDIVALLKPKGYVVVRQYVVDYAGRNVKLDLFVRGWRKHPEFGISLKHQGGGGTTDQKLLYEADVLHHAVPFPCVIVLSGDGWSQAVLDLVERRRKELYTSVLGLWRYDDLVQWVIKLPRCRHSELYQVDVPAVNSSIGTQESLDLLSGYRNRT